MSDLPPQATRQFLEQMGLHMQDNGLPRISGKILALIIVEARPLSFGGLAEMLEVSRGSISTNTRMLEKLGFIERVALPGERQLFFDLSPNPYGKLVAGLLERHQRAQKMVRSALESLPAESGGGEKRLRQLADFFEIFEECNQAMLARLAELEEAS